REAMPQLFYQLGHLLPLTFYLEILRAIVLKGIGINFLWSQVFALIVYILVALSISIMKFQKKIA
ncbi:MAG: ybhS, partial [Firmicutes bacterium]|nr:ybhS [Bacillota bacterium]